MLARLFRTITAGFMGAVFGVFITMAAFFATGPHGHADPIPEALAQRRLAEERAGAELLGFVIDRELPIQEMRASVDATTLDAGECIAVIAAAWGSAHVGAIAIVPPAGPRRHARDDDVLSVHTTRGGVVVAHTQYCAPHARDIEIWTWVDERATPAPRAIGGRILVLRGRIDPESLSRGLTLRPEWDIAPMVETPDAGQPDAGRPDGGSPAASAVDGGRRHRRTR